MASLTLNEVILGLRDLLGEKLELFKNTHAAALYVARMRVLLDEALALPPVVVQDKSVSQALAEADTWHDAYARALWLLLDAYLSAPDSSEELRKDAEAIRGAFVPSRAETLSAYAIEAERAMQRTASAPDWQEKLAQFPAAAGWLSGMLEQGKKLGELLRYRGEQAAEEKDRKQAAELRSKILGLFGKLRAALLDELEVDSSLPSDLAARVFSYIDELTRMAEDRGKAKLEAEAAEAEGA